LEINEGVKTLPPYSFFVAFLFQYPVQQANGQLCWIHH